MPGIDVYYYSNTKHLFTGDIYVVGGITATNRADFKGGLSAISLTANSATGFADESTIGYTTGGKLQVLSVPYTSIVYPFGLDSLSFSANSSVVLRFTDSKSTTGNGSINSTSVS